jgi:Ser/Thr protein kinase RdoA (MazF antagonist)
MFKEQVRDNTSTGLRSRVEGLLSGSPSAKRRAKRLSQIVHREVEQLRRRIAAADLGDEPRLAEEAIELVAATAPRELAKAEHWSLVDLPLQHRMGDVHHDHILFTDDRVTGVVDFGAADIDSPAGDVARLLGSLVGDDVLRREEGLAAYQAVRPLTPVEVGAMDFFDTSSTVASAANWIAWLWPNSSEQPPRINRTAGLERLRQLLVRLRVLALHRG